MTAVNEIAPQPVTATMLHEALRQSFSEVFEVEIVAAPLCLAEERLANALYTTKYTNAVWNLEGAAAWRHSMAPIRTT
jgi:lipoate-protein ligase A